MRNDITAFGTRDVWKRTFASVCSINVHVPAEGKSPCKTCLSLISLSMCISWEEISILQLEVSIKNFIKSLSSQIISNSTASLWLKPRQWLPQWILGNKRFKDNIDLETLIEALQVKSHVDANICMTVYKH